MNRIDLKQWLQKPPITGYRAICWALVAIALPTILRTSVDDVVSGVGVTPFVPFVLISSIFLDWKYAAAVVLAAAIIADAFFIGLPPQLLEGPSDIFALAMFFAATAMIIGFVQLVRRLVADDNKLPKRLNGIVFSQEDGEAWAGWHGLSSRVHLGPQDEVAEMMQDFLAQQELAKYLESKVTQDFR